MQDLRKSMTNRLFTPGPTTIPPFVQKAMAQPLMYHKSAEFREIMSSVLDGLMYVFCTNEIVLPIACSATGAAEAVVSNLHSHGDKVLVLNNGRFAQRWRSMLELFGITVINEEIEWGDAPSVEQVTALLAAHQDIKAIWIVHCETSTGTVANVKELAATIRAKSDALICVDGVSSVGALECKMDDWGIDALICGSQKALMTPPGLGFVSLSRKAWSVVETKKTSSFYFDLQRLRAAAEKNLGVFTPAVSLLMGLQAALHSIKTEGLEKVIQRHSLVADIVREGVKELGLQLLSRYPSDSLTVVQVKNADDIITRLNNEFGVTVAGGQDDFSGKVIRIGHMGYVYKNDAQYFLDGLRQIIHNNTIDNKK